MDPKITMNVAVKVSLVGFVTKSATGSIWSSPQSVIRMSPIETGMTGACYMIKLHNTQHVCYPYPHLFGVLFDIIAEVLSRSHE